MLKSINSLWGDEMKIYTKTGDKGETGLLGGGRVPKNDVRVEAYGAVDELNALLGIAENEVISEKTKEILTEIQNHLFVLGADLATPKENTKIPRVTEEMIEFLEKQIDELDSIIPALRSFILPGGSKGASFLHFARTVCRRAERNVVSLEKKSGINNFVLAYLNRLSDLLFVLARFENFSAKVTEKEWKK